LNSSLTLNSTHS